MPPPRVPSGCAAAVVVDVPEGVTEVAMRRERPFTGEPVVTERGVLGAGAAGGAAVDGRSAAGGRTHLGGDVPEAVERPCDLGTLIAGQVGERFGERLGDGLAGSGHGLET